MIGELTIVLHHTILLEFHTKLRVEELGSGCSAEQLDESRNDTFPLLGRELADIVLK